MSITVHTICKNEEKWIWYSLMSVIDNVDKILVYDTGSTDNTLEIVKSINSKKIEITEFKDVDKKEFTSLRNRQIEETKTEWIFVLDSDEIWQKDMLNEVIKRIKSSKDDIYAAFVHYFEFVNDIFHYYRGHEQIIYPLHNRKEYGWYTIRFIRNIVGLKCVNDYGKEGYFLNNIELQRFGKSENYIWCNDIYYFHTRNLLRSSSEEKDREVMMRIEKRHDNKIEKIPNIYRGLQIKYPEVFFMNRPAIVPEVFRI